MLRYILCTAVLMSLFTSAYAQQLAEQKTDSHVLIEGTNIYMIPPPSFAMSSQFKGFQNPESTSSMIMIMEIPGPYSEVTKGFNEEMLASGGIELISKTQVQLADMDGLLLELEQPANGFVFAKHILVYGNENTSTLINGVCLKDSIQLIKEIEQSILSTFADTNLTSDPRQALAYEINENIGGFKFHSVIGNATLLNRDLKTPTESPDKGVVIIDRSFAQVDIMDKKSFCINKVAQYPDPYTVDMTTGVQEITIDSLSGYSLHAQNEGDQQERMYQVILFDEEGSYYIFLGTYDKNYEDTLTDIKAVMNSFKLK